MLEGVTTFSFLLAVILLLVFLIFLTVFVILVYSGLFTPIEEVKTAAPPFADLIIAYKFERGPYNEAGQLFTEACMIAPENKAVGIYYDDPGKVEALHLRYVVGSVLAEKGSSVDESLMKQFTEKGYKMLHLPQVTYMVQTKFPHVTTLSILLAVRKAYPQMQNYVEERKLCAHPFLEFYDGQTIHFLAPLSKQDEFYVPECNSANSGGGDETNPGETRLGADSSINASNSEVEEDMLNNLDLTQSTVDTTTSCNEHPPRLDSTVGDEEQEVSDDSSSSFEVVKNI